MLPPLMITSMQKKIKISRYQLVISGFIVNQRIFQSDWMRDTNNNNQPKTQALPSPWWLSPCKIKKKKKKKNHFIFQRILQSDWMMAKWPYLTKKGSLTWYLPLIIIFMQRISEINRQRILQSDWTRGTTGHYQPRVAVSDVAFPC